MDKLKVFTDRHKIAELERSVNETIEGSNSLIDIFHEFQPFMRINSVTDFESLVYDPGALYDHLLTTNVQFNAAPGMKVDPGQLAKLFNLDRENFLNLVAGKPIKIENCAPCGRIKTKPGQACISRDQFNAYKAFMLFEDFEFVKDLEAIEEKAKDFDFYATTPAQLSIVKHYDDLTAILNKHCAENEVSDRIKEGIATSFHLLLSNGISGNFVVDSEHIKNLIF